MAKFDLTALNIDLSRLVPTQSDMQTLVGAFKDTVRDSVSTDRELLHSLCDGIGEVRLRGICRRLSNSERAEMISLLLPEIEIASSRERELVQRLLETSPNLIALHDTLERIGFECFEEGPALRWFGHLTQLALAAVELRGDDFLSEVSDDPDQALDSIATIGEVLQHNAEVFSRHENLASSPIAFNAQRLLDSFNEARWGVEDIAEFARAWNERISIHTTTGLGVYDSPDLRLSSDELRDIRRGLEKFPAYVLTLENVVLDLQFRNTPEGRDGALGGYNLGRIYLFDAVRDARAGIDYPEGAVNGVVYTTVHETSHAAHTVGMMDFKRISGWIRVNNLQFRDPQTDSHYTVSKDMLSAGEVVELDSGRYVVALYGEPEKFEFPMDITIENPYNASECGYLHRADAQFVSDYAATSPEEDYAETLATFLLDPEKLKRLAPEKYDFMNYLYGKVGAA
jgi:hypothetical protein